MKFLKSFKRKKRKRRQPQKKINFYKELNKLKVDLTPEKRYNSVCRERGYYIDRRGYYRYNNRGNLVHRHIAYKYIYLPNKSDYKFHFREYVVHHKNGNKRDNRVTNLEILTWEEHGKKHKQLQS